MRTNRHAKLVLRGLALGVLTGLLVPGAALAHGPSVRLSYGSVKPAKLAIRAGQTVHFQNVSSVPRSFTLVADDGTFESPTLARGEGWHHEFAEPGQYAFRVSEFPEMTGLVVVAPAAP